MAKISRLIRITAFRKLALLALALGAVVLLAGCSGRTTGATSITTNSAQLNSIGSCDQGNCSAYFRWRAVGTTTWTNAPTINNIGAVSNIAWAQIATGLTPGTQYEYQACGREAYFGPNIFVCSGPDGLTTSTQAFSTLPPPDTTPPAVTLTQPPDGSTTTNPRPPLSGAAGDAAGDANTVTVKVYAGSSATGTPVQVINTTRSASSWSTTPTSDLATGTYTARAEQSDAAGNLGQSSPMTFAVDTTPPAVTLTQPPDGSNAPNSRPALSGAAGDAAGDGATVTVKVYAGTGTSGTLIESIDTTRAGNSWSVTPTADLAFGTYTARAEQSDALGNVGHSATATFTVVPDTAPPAVGLSEPANGASISDPRPALSGAAGNAFGDATTVTVKIFAGTDTSGTLVDSSETTRAGNSWSTIPTTDLTPGTYTARAEQSDAAGNVGQSATATFAIDTAAPEVTLSQPNDGSVTSNPRPALSGAAGDAAGDSNAVSVRIYAGTSTSGTLVTTVNTTRTSASWSTAPTADLSAGVFTASAEQSDAAGNIGQSAPSTFTVDTVAPAVTVTQPADGSNTLNPRPTLSGAAGDAAGDGATIAVGIYSGTSATGSPVETLSTDRAGNSWSTAPTADLTPGIYTVRASQSDAAGNLGQSAPATFTLGADTTPPAVTLAQPVDGSTTTNPRPPLAGAAGNAVGDGATVTVKIYTGTDTSGTLVEGIGTTRSGGSWSTTPTSDLATGTYTARAEQSDAAGNLGQSATSTFTVDTTPPSVTLTQPANGSATANPLPAFSGAAGNAVGDSDTIIVQIYSGSSASGTPLQTIGTTRTGSSWSDTPTAALATGTYTARAEQSDVAGNVGQSAASTFTVDSIPPAVTLTQPAPGTVTSNLRPTLSGAAGNTSGDGATVTVKIYSGTGTGGALVQTLNTTRSGATWSTNPTSDLALGTYTARAEQSDAAGNLGQSRAETFTVGTYRDNVMADSPRAYWRLGESAGTSAADETAANPGTYQNGPTLGQAGVVGGDPNTAVSFDGVNDQVQVNSSSSLNPTAGVSVEAWLRPTALPGDTATLVRKDLQYLLRVKSGGSAIFRVWKSTGSYTELQTAAGLIGTGSWYQIAATFDGSTMRIFINGTQRASKAYSGTFPTGTSPLYLGSSGGYDRLSGRLDEVAVYSGALSAARVQAHYVRAYLIDTTAPTVNLKTPAAGSAMEAKPSFGGTAGTTPGDSNAVTVKLYSGSSATGSPIQTLATARSGQGTFSVLASASLASGTYTAVAEQADSSGNVGQSAAKTFTVNAGADPKILAAADIASCSSSGDEATAALLDGLGGSVLAVGDTVYENGTAAEFANCYDPTWGRHLARTRPIVGDHEYGTPGAAEYFAYFGAAAGPAGANKGYYSYDIGSWHVVALNSVCYELDTCTTSMENWLEQDLIDHPNTCTLALYHEPLFSSGNVHGNNPGGQYLWQLLYAAGADVMLSGSEHIYERFAPQTPSGVANANGIRQFTVGTGGRSHYGIGTIQPNSEVRNADSYGLLEMKLHPASYEWQFIPEAGKTFTDSGSTSCH